MPRRKSAHQNRDYARTKNETSAADLVGGGEISGGRIVHEQISEGFTMNIMDSEKPHYVPPQFNSPTTQFAPILGQIG